MIKVFNHEEYAKKRANLESFFDYKFNNKNEGYAIGVIASRIMDHKLKEDTIPEVIKAANGTKNMAQLNALREFLEFYDKQGSRYSDPDYYLNVLYKNYNKTALNIAKLLQKDNFKNFVDEYMIKTNQKDSDFYLSFNEMIPSFRKVAYLEDESVLEKLLETCSSMLDSKHPYMLQEMAKYYEDLSETVYYEKEPKAMNVFSDLMSAAIEKAKNLKIDLRVIMELAKDTAECTLPGRIGSKLKKENTMGYINCLDNPETLRMTNSAIWSSWFLEEMGRIANTIGHETVQDIAYTLNNIDKEKQEKLGSELKKLYDKNAKTAKKEEIEKVLQATGLGTRFF